MPPVCAIVGDADDPGTLAKPADIAKAYWLTHLQPKGAWSNEVDLRPYTETWTY